MKCNQSSSPKDYGQLVVDIREGCLFKPARAGFDPMNGYAELIKAL